MKEFPIYIHSNETNLTKQWQDRENKSHIDLKQIHITIYTQTLIIYFMHLTIHLSNARDTFSSLTHNKTQLHI